MFPSHVEFLKHILDECNYLLSEGNDISFNEFIANKTLSKAFCGSLEIIGEATKNIDAGLKEKYPLVDWKTMAGIRDKIIPDYFSVDY